VVVSIIAVVAALLFPVIAGSKSAARESECMARLRQWHQAIMLYQAEWSGGVTYGAPHEMGLPVPTTLTTMVDAGYMPMTMVLDPGGMNQHRSIPAQYSQQWYDPQYEQLRPGIGMDSWAPYVLRYGENSILVVDKNHQPTGTVFGSRFQTHKGIGVYLGGHVRTLMRKGAPMDREWWN